MKSKELLERYLAKKYPHLGESLSDGDKVFLSRYAIERQQSNSVAMLKELKLGNSYDKYFREHEYARIVKDDIQNIYQRFTVKQNEKNYAPFNNDFSLFMEWWLSEMDDRGRHHCCYCGVDDETLRAAFDNGVIHSKKPSFSGNLQIERMDPDGGYHPENCKFACVICNNAKSDMISREEFEKYIAPSIAKFWEHIKTDCLGVN